NGGGHRGVVGGVDAAAGGAAAGPALSPRRLGAAIDASAGRAPCLAAAVRAGLAQPQSRRRLIPGSRRVEDAISLRTPTLPKPKNLQSARHTAVTQGRSAWASSLISRASRHGRLAHGQAAASACPSLR